MLNIETPSPRFETLKKAIVGTGLVATIASGAVVGDYYFIADVGLHGRWFTRYEYAQLKTDLIQKVKANKVTPMTIEEAELWRASVERECKNMTFVRDDGQMITQENIVETINLQLEKGC